MAGTVNNEETNDSDDAEALKPGETPVIGAGTITRTAALAVAFVLAALSGVNQWLVSQGRSPLNVDQATISNAVTYLVSLAAAIWAWWKPNNFTARARRKYALAETIQQDMLLQEAKKAYAASGLHVQEAKKEVKDEPQEQASNIEAPASSADEARSAQDEGETGPGTGRAAATDARAALAAALKDLD
ncbi:MAG: phage holin [Parascardovia denticolens]